MVELEPIMLLPLLHSVLTYIPYRLFQTSKAAQITLHVWVYFFFSFFNKRLIFSPGYMPESTECWCHVWQLLLKTQPSIVPSEAAKQWLNWLIKDIQCWIVKAFSFPFCPFHHKCKWSGPPTNPFVSSLLSSSRFSTLLVAATSNVPLVTQKTEAPEGNSLSFPPWWQTLEVLKKWACALPCRHLVAH